MHFTVDQILKATQGQLISGSKDQVIRSVSTDTRKIKRGDFYVPLVGKNLDGHQFIEEAKEKGAMGALVASEKNNLGKLKDFLIISVPDTLFALGEIARAWRKKFNIPVVVITGSSGKTTTKEMIASCLSTVGEVNQTRGNFNNLIGLPLTIFELTPQHQFAVWEIGMNAFGEIDRLTQVADPTLGIITNVGLAHLEGVKNIEGAAKAKGELFLRLKPDATALVNLDDPHIAKMKTRAKRFTYGSDPLADIAGKSINSFTLPFNAKHLRENFLACYVVCLQLGLTKKQIQEGISSFQLVKNRGGQIILSQNITLIDDTYNANPSSMEVALKMFAESFSQNRKIAVLGEMYELGDESIALHQKTGEMVATLGIEVLFAYGGQAGEIVKGYQKGSSGGKSEFFSDINQLNLKLSQCLKRNDAILVKGSRGAAMERVVNFLKQNHGG